MNNYFKTNQALWDQKTGVHKDAPFYDLAGFKEGKTSLQEIELAALSGQVEGKDLLHLQCHFGQDTLSFARMGAKVTGVDLSPNSIKLAQELSTELKLDGRFITTNLYDIRNHLTEQFDIVFTSYGTVTWLPDLNEWAAIISEYLKPGGVFYMAEFHPALYMYDHDTGKIGFRYFNQKTPYEDTPTGTYADESAEIGLKEYFWCHSLSEVLQPLLQHGLILEEFKEFPFSPYECFPNMVELEPRRYVFGDPENRLPHVFSLKMRKG